MKTALLVLVLTALAACEKKRYCDCHMLRHNSVRDPGTYETTYVLKGSRASVEDACAALERTGTDEKGPFVRDCEIK